ncbi:MAG: thioredoxin domain-containing protein [Candidatus Anammoxibacter sp.]
MFGGGIYACVVCLIILSIFAKGMVLRRYISAITIIGLVSFCFSIYLAVVSVFILHAICILCVGTYFINLFIFIGGAFASCRVSKGDFGPVKKVIMPFGRTAEPAEATALGNALGIFVIIMVVIQGFFAAIYLDTKYLGFTEEDIASFKEKYMAIKPQTIDLADSPYWGTNDPDLTIVVFEDFLCSFCKRSHVTAFPIFKEYKSRIKVVFKYLPYDKECNPSLKKGIHPGACRSSIAAACASLQGEFARFQEYFFKHQEVIKPDMDIIKVASDIGGIDEEEFKSCIEQGKGEWAVRRDFAEAMKLKVRRTPAYFFNGRKWEGALKPIFIKRILEWELKEKE